MPQTQSALINAALVEVGALGAGQTPSAEDVAAVQPRIAPILADLAARRATGTIAADAISDSVFPDLVRIVAEHIAPMFGRATNGDTVQAVEKRLRELARLDTTTDDTFVLGVMEQLEIYQAGANVLDAAAISRRLPGIFAELAARDVVTVLDTDDVPDAVVPDLTRYVAASLAVPQMTTVMQFSEQRLTRMQALPSRGGPVRATYF